MDMCLSEAIGERASVQTRPDMEAVIRWFASHGQTGDTIEACVFANVARGMETAMAGWVASLRHLGFAVFVKPKQHRRDDVDIEMLRHIERRAAQGSLLELVVASHDAKAFATPLTRLATNGLTTAVLGYRERDVFAAESDVIRFVDVEDVPDAFTRPLPRTNLFDLTVGGRWFSPFVEVEPTPPEPEIEVPDRATIVATVIDAVDGAAADGRHGLTLAEVGELVRTTWPGLHIDDAGFASVSELLDALLATASVVVERHGDGPRTLVPVVIDLVDAPPDHEDVAEEPISQPEPEPDVDETELDVADVDVTDVGRGQGEHADADGDAEEHERSHAIYRMFRYEPPATAQ